MADHRQTSRRVIDAYTSGDLTGLEDAFTAGHVMHDPQNPFAREMHAIDALRSMVSMYRTAFPDLVLSADAQYEDGDVVITRWTATGTHNGDLPSLPATGRHSTVTGILIDRYEGERIAESWGNWDTLGMLQQLGAISAPEAAPAGQA